MPAAAASPGEPEGPALGRALFEDKRLSADGSVSCASCHQKERAFTDGRAVAEGVRGQLGTRNTPSLLNVAYGASFFWDGRRPTLEEQASDPLLNPVEHGLRSEEQLLEIVRAAPDYQEAFRKIFGVAPEAITMDQIRQALATYERTLLSGDSPFDRYQYGHDPTALSGAAVRGLELFRGRAGCATCHTIGPEGALFTDHRFHRLGVGFERIAARLAQITVRLAGSKGAALDQAVLTQADLSELGRFAVTLDPADIGRFKTPSLRNVAVTAPYMHDGSIATLEQAVAQEIYYRALTAGHPLILTPAEKEDLIEFLKALTSPEFAPPAAAMKP